MLRWIIVVAMPLFTLCLGCADKTNDKTKDKTKDAILRVLQADKQVHTRFERLPPNTTPSQFAWSVDQYCQDLERLDMTDCPADFRVAYTQHIRAWREVGGALRKLPDGFLQGVFMGLVNSALRGEMDGGQRRLEGMLNRAVERVRVTWEEVEKTGAKYGAAL